jgi:hypothetical protein
MQHFKLTIKIKALKKYIEKYKKHQRNKKLYCTENRKMY